MNEAVLAVDLGGTNMRVAAVGPDGTVGHRVTRPTPKAPEPESLTAMAREVLDLADLSAAVVGVPGRVDYAEGRVEHAPNLPRSWVDDLTAVALEKELGVPVSLANDADLAAVGETYAGAGRDCEDVAYVTISTGVGAGVLLGRRLVHGRRSIAELGHTTIAYQSPQGTVEDLGSGTALNALAQETGLTAEGPELDRLVERGDDKATAVWERVLAAAAVGVANLAHLFSPEMVIIGGGLGRSSGTVLETVHAGLERFGPKDLPEPIEVVPAELGDGSGLVGAAFWRQAAPRTWN